MGRSNVRVRDLGVGTTLDENVYTSDGKTLLLKRGISLTVDFINGLLKRGIETVSIESPGAGEQSGVAVVGDITFTYPKSLEDRLFLRYEGKTILKLDDPAVRRTKQKAIQKAHKLLDKVAETHTLDTAEAVGTVGEIIDAITVNHQAFLNIAGVKEYDEYTFEHSVGVATFTTIIAKERGVDADSLASICTGALLHDVGKMLIDQNILNKPGRLTDEEFEVMKTHSRKGFELLTENGVDEPVAAIALGHHERCDGTGYPEGLSLQKTPEPAQMSAIADVYDALTSDRVYKKAMDVITAMKIILAESGKQFNKELVSIFQRTIGIYPIGSLVRLNTGFMARVLDQNEGIVRPVIQLLKDQSGKPLEDQRIINLMDDQKLFIQECLED
jgi:putative nucleotidyltransferase with HDIG domain